ncbi:MAG: DUF5685 family protein [Lachnospiraceae bacterium]
MFGYINVNQKELSEKNRESYQSYYCGLCRELKRFSGMKGQMLLNYDMTFLIILLTGLYEPVLSQDEFTCPLHPFHKKNATSDEATEYAAKMNILLSYHNFEDDWQDDRSIGKKALVKLFTKEYKQIRLQYPRQSKAIETYMTKLSIAESGNETNIDAVAGLTGEMLAEVFAWKEDEWAGELRCMGFYMGKFIYLMDAYEDRSKDYKKGLYNPFYGTYKEHKNEKEFDVYVRLILMSMMSECAKAFERLPILMNADILRNILYSGVWTKFEYSQARKDKKTKKQEEK